MTTMLLIQTTLPSKKEAKKLTGILLESKLCACVQYHKTKSQYVWEGKLCKAKEYLLIIKTLPHCQKAVEKLIVTHHSYQTPEIVCCQASASAPYFHWLKQSIRSQNPKICKI